MTHANHQGEPGDTGTGDPTAVYVSRDGKMSAATEADVRRIFRIASAPTPPDRVGEEVGRGNVLPSWVADMQPTLSRSGNDITLSYCNPNDAAYTFAEMERFFDASDFAFAPSPEAGAGGDLGELERLSAAATPGMARAYMDKYRLRVGPEDSTFENEFVTVAVTSTCDKASSNLVFLAALWNAHRSGKLVASTGSGEETKGATPMGSGHSRAEPSGLGASPECPSRMALPIATAPKFLGQILLYGNLKGSPEKTWHIGKWHRGFPHGWWISSSVEVEATHWAALPLTHWVEVSALGTEAEGQDAEGSLVHEGPADLSATPEATPKSSPSQTPVDPQMTVEEARGILEELDPKMGSPELQAEELRAVAKALRGGVPIELLVRAGRIEAALRTLQAAGEVRHDQ